MKKISTSALSKILDVNSKELFTKLEKEGLIYRNDERWCLKNKGKEYGGETVFNKKYGDYVVWPEDFDPYNLRDENRQELISVTNIGEEFNISSQRINLILTEIGWIEKGIKGWTITSLGRKVKGIQIEHSSGGTYVKWPKSILKNTTLIRSLTSENTQSNTNKKSNNDSVIDDFRTKFPANYRTKDGHQVRSRAEAIIDNALYDYGLAHAYERKLPIEEDVYSDFYIPSKNGGKAVYIEFWGLEDQPQYAKRKQIKKDLYHKNDFNLIELSDKHIENLDDYLPRMLLKFNIRVE